MMSLRPGRRVKQLVTPCASEPSTFSFIVNRTRGSNGRLLPNIRPAFLISLARRRSRDAPGGPGESCARCVGDDRRAIDGHSLRAPGGADAREIEFQTCDISLALALATLRYLISGRRGRQKFTLRARPDYAKLVRLTASRAFPSPLAPSARPGALSIFIECFNIPFSK